MEKSLLLVLIVAISLPFCSAADRYSFNVCENEDRDCTTVKCYVSYHAGIRVIRDVRCTYNYAGKIHQLPSFKIYADRRTKTLDIIKKKVRKALSFLDLFKSTEPTTTEPTTAGH